jgi:hypothetical protein
MIAVNQLGMQWPYVGDGCLVLSSMYNNSIGSQGEKMERQVNKKHGTKSAV